MSEEEVTLEDLEEEAETGMLSMPDLIWRRRERLQQKNKATIEDFLGEGDRADAVTIMPRYYGELLTWALKRHLEKEGWKVIRALGYHGRKPVYIDVSTDYDHHENLLRDGQLLIEKGDRHFVVTVDINLQWRNSVQVEAPAPQKKAVERFVHEVKIIAEKQNFYRGKKIEFGGRIHFLNVRDKSWDSIILDTDVMREIRANTIEFLNKKECWAKYGIPQKRGILLAGEPGTGKTVICKALMAESDGVTCITANAYALSADGYITELYDMAEDLSPCIVFIEDIDLIGLNREENHYQHGPALLSLLNVLDGVEEKQEIITVATTNSLDALDRAITQRPSRFDRVVKLSLPLLEERKKLVSLLSQKIPVDEPTQDYIARKAERCTPAQLQEIVYSLVIEHDEEFSELPNPEISKDDVDHIISRINGRNGHRIGFDLSDSRDGHKAGYLEVRGKGGC